MIGWILSHYKVLEELSCGGIGIVCRDREWVEEAKVKLS
jgi:hypothetical protein